eukprot:scaffold3978_cov291-Pinguiococcus_pyrenoidosus.AAC.17
MATLFDGHVEARITLEGSGTALYTHDAVSDEGVRIDSMRRQIPNGTRRLREALIRTPGHADFRQSETEASQGAADSIYFIWEMVTGERLSLCKVCQELGIVCFESTALGNAECDPPGFRVHFVLPGQRSGCYKPLSVFVGLRLDRAKRKAVDPETSLLPDASLAVLSLLSPPSPRCMKVKPGVIFKVQASPEPQDWPEVYQLLPKTCIVQSERHEKLIAPKRLAGRQVSIAETVSNFGSPLRKQL